MFTLYQNDLGSLLDGFYLASLSVFETLGSKRISML